MVACRVAQIDACNQPWCMSLCSRCAASHVADGNRCFMQATPANWPNNHESIGAKGWAFILPTVTAEDADKVGSH